MTSDEVLQHLGSAIAVVTRTKGVRSVATVVDWQPWVEAPRYLMADATGPITPHKAEAIGGLLSNTRLLIEQLCELQVAAARQQFRQSSEAAAEAISTWTAFTDLIATLDREMRDAIRQTDSPTPAKDL